MMTQEEVRIIYKGSFDKLRETFKERFKLRDAILQTIYQHKIAIAALRGLLNEAPDAQDPEVECVILSAEDFEALCSLSEKTNVLYDDLLDEAASTGIRAMTAEREKGAKS